MAKLKVTVDTRFSTGPMQSNKLGKLTGAKATQFFSKVDLEKLGFDLVSTNEDAEVGFEFDKKTMKKGALFDVKLNTDANGFEAHIAGEFEITLRSGVAPILQGLGDKLDLRIRGISYAGGKYSSTGFIAWVVGGDYGQEGAEWPKTFPTVASFAVK